VKFPDICGELSDLVWLAVVVLCILQTYRDNRLIDKSHGDTKKSIIELTILTFGLWVHGNLCLAGIMTAFNRYLFVQDFTVAKLYLGLCVAQYLIYIMVRTTVFRRINRQDAARV
jgi:hypothetical protein